MMEIGKLMSSTKSTKTFLTLLSPSVVVAASNTILFDFHKTQKNAVTLSSIDFISCFNITMKAAEVLNKKGKTP